MGILSFNLLNIIPYKISELHKFKKIRLKNAENSVFFSKK